MAAAPSEISALASQLASAPLPGDNVKSTTIPEQAIISPQNRYEADLAQLLITQGTTTIAGYQVASPSLASFMLLELLGNSLAIVPNLGEVPATMFTFTTIQALAVLRFKDAYALVQMISKDRDAFDRFVVQMTEELPPTTNVMDVAIQIIELMNGSKRSSAAEVPDPKKRKPPVREKKESRRRGGSSQPA